MSAVFQTGRLSLMTGVLCLATLPAYSQQRADATATEEGIMRLVAGLPEARAMIPAHWHKPHDSVRLVTRIDGRPRPGRPYYTVAVGTKSDRSSWPLYTSNAEFYYYPKIGHILRMSIGFFPRPVTFARYQKQNNHVPLAARILMAFGTRCR